LGHDYRSSSYDHFYSFFEALWSNSIKF